MARLGDMTLQRARWLLAAVDPAEVAATYGYAFEAESRAEVGERYRELLDRVGGVGSEDVAELDSVVGTMALLDSEWWFAFGLFVGESIGRYEEWRSAAARYFAEEGQDVPAELELSEAPCASTLLAAAEVARRFVDDELDKGEEAH
jgi:hypothetical protein